MNYKFLIYISYGYAIPIGIPLEKEILKRGYTVKWFTDISETNKFFTSLKNVFHNIKEVVYYKPDIVLTATDDVPDFITGIKVQIFHGFFAQKRPLPNNKFYHFRIRGFFDLYCTQGPSTTSIFKEIAKQKKYFEVIETGWSKVDPLFPLEELKNDPIPNIPIESTFTPRLSLTHHNGIFQEIAKQKKYFEVIETSWSKVDPLFPLEEIKNDPIPNILIASTFTPRLSLAHHNGIFQEISRLAGLGIYNFSMVLHPKMDSKIVSKWKNLKSLFFTFYDTTDLIPLYKKATILFSDTSSAIQEFLLLKKPVVTFNHTFYHNYLIHVSEIKNIENDFQEALKYPDELLKQIEKFNLELHPYYDGNSSNRVIDNSIEYLHKDKSYLKSKPINLIRKFKIRKKLNYFTLKSFGKPYTLNKISTNNIPPIEENTLKNKIQLSAVIIIYNEEEHIEKCLNSLIDVADEIVVVDSFSTDNSEAICKKFNVRFIQHDFEGYIEQKNFAIIQASNDYILSLDGDEALSEQLKDSILKIKQNWKYDGYYTNRLNNYCGAWIKHSDWYPDRKLRLFKKGRGEWKGINPHDKYTLKNDKKAGQLKGDLLHWIYRDYDEHKQKVENFSNIASEAYYKLGIKSSIFKICYRPLWAFIKSYFLRLGFLDGKNGLQICIQSFNVTYLKYNKLYKLWH